MADFKLGRIKFKWKGAWTSATAYIKDDIVRVNGNSYVCITNHTSSANLAGWYSTDFANWNLYVPGVNPTGSYSSGTTYYLNDIVTYNGSTWISLTNSNTGNTPTTTPSAWSMLVQGAPDMVTQNVYYVSTSTGSDGNNGQTIASAWKTLRYACSQVTGPATIFVKTGVYAEQLPITVPAGVSIIGDGMRDTEIKPLIGTVVTAYVATGSSGTTLKVATTVGVGAGMTVTGTGIGSGRTVVAVVDGITVTLSSAPNGTPSGNITFQYLSTDASPVANNLSTMFYLSDSTLLQGLLMTGMTGFTFNPSYPTDVTQATIGGVYLRLNPQVTITVKSPYVKDCTAKSSGGVGAIVNGTDQSGGIKSMVFWAYNIVMDGGVGIWAANGGKVEAVSVFTYYCYLGYTASGGGLIRSIGGNNSYGTYGAVSLGYLASETPVTGSVYGNMLTFPTITLTGTFTQGEIIRQPNIASITITTSTCTSTTATVNYATQGSAPFVTGQTIAVAGNTTSGYNGTWTVLTSSTTQTTFSVSPASGLSSGTGGTIKGYASAYITSVQTGYLYYKQQYGTFNTTNTVTGVSSGAQMTPSADGGQSNAVLVLNSLSTAPVVGASISFATGDTYTYVISAVSTATINSISVTIITLAQSKVAASTDGTSVNIRYNFSLIRLQSHDFLSIGTGGVTTTNYPGIPTQSPAPANQIVAPGTQAGRVYYVATDELGNFNVGNYFSVNQATGSATLNASAFNLSGLTSLRLGSVGAQLGAQINEFSTDGTLSQNSDVKVPTQHAITTYLGAIQPSINPNISPATDLGVDLGTPTKRFAHLYVGPGSITLGTVTLTDNSGTLAVSSGGGGNVSVPGNLVVTGNLTVNGSQAYIQGTNTVYTDNLIELHAPTGGVGGTWSTNDGYDIGLRFHYYNSGDKNAALVMANDTNALEWYVNGSETNGVFSRTYGTIKTASFLATSSVKFQATGGGSNYVAFQPPATIASNVTWTLPAADATTAGFALVSNGSGVLSWAAAGAAIATDTTDGTLYPTMTTLTTGNFTAAKVNTGLSFNAINQTLSVTSVSGQQAATFTRTNATQAAQGVVQILRSSTSTGYLGFDASDNIAMFDNSGTLRSSFTTTGQSVVGTVTSTTGFVEGSSIALKENVAPIENALETILQLCGVTYDRKDGSRKNEPGLIAERVAEIADNLVMRDEKGNPTGIYYSKITAYLVEAIKGLHSQIDPLKEEIKKLKGE
jgi:hypothetical protein